MGVGTCPRATSSTACRIGTAEDSWEEERGEYSRSMMRRWRSALTPVLLSPFTWQTEDSWRLNKLVPCTCLINTLASCLVMEGSGDAMAGDGSSDGLQLQLQLRVPVQVQRQVQLQPRQVQPSAQARGWKAGAVGSRSRAKEGAQPQPHERQGQACRLCAEMGFDPAIGCVRAYAREGRGCRRKLTMCGAFPSPSR